MLQINQTGRNVPLGDVQSDGADRDVTLDNVHSDGVDRTVLVDMLQTDGGYRNVLVDMLPTDGADRNVHLDTFKAYRPDRDVPLDLLQAYGAGTDFPEDMLQANGAGRDVPLDLLQADEADTDFPVDMLQANGAGTDFPVDMLQVNGAGMRRPPSPRKVVGDSFLFCWLPYVTNNKKTSRMPYQCDYCGTRFADLTEMCFHRKTHEKDSIPQKRSVLVEKKVPFFHKTSVSEEKKVPFSPKVSVQPEHPNGCSETPPDILPEQKQENASTKKCRQRKELRLLSSYVKQLRQFRRERKDGVHKNRSTKLSGVPGWTKSHSRAGQRLPRAGSNPQKNSLDTEGSSRKSAVFTGHGSNVLSASEAATTSMSELDIRGKDATPARMVKQKRTRSAESADCNDKCPDLKSSKTKTPKDNSPFECVTSGKTCKMTAQLAHHQNSHTDMSNSVEVLPEYDLDVFCRCDSIGQTLKICDLKRNKTGRIQPTPLKAEKSHLACEYCGKNFPSNRKFLKHRKSLEKKLDELLKIERANFKEFICDICHENFARASQLAKHKKIHVSKARKLQELSSLHQATSLYSCSICQRGYTKASRLARHLKKHSPQSRNFEDQSAQPQVVFQAFSCDVCSRVYTTASSFNRHRKKHTVQQSDKVVTDGQHILSNPTLLKGDTCTGTLKTSTHLAGHKNKHTTSTPSQKDKDNPNLRKEQRLVCGVCQKKYRQVCSYANHWQGHLDNPQELAAHLSKNSCVKQFTCVVCDRTFKTSAHLGRHRKQHVELSSERLAYNKDTLVSSSAVTVPDGTTPSVECGQQQTQKDVLAPDHEGNSDERLAHVCTSDNCCRRSPKVSLPTVCKSPYLENNPKSFILGSSETLSKEAQKPTCDTSFTCDECYKKFQDSAKIHATTNIAQVTYELNDIDEQVAESNSLNNAKCDMKLPEFDVSQQQLHQLHYLVPTQETPTSGLLVPPGTFDELAEEAKEKENAGGLPEGENGARSPSSCHECDKIFRVPVFLKLHKRIHSGEKLHTCMKCGKGFLAATYLRTHARVHS